MATRDYSLINAKNLGLERKYISGRYYGPRRDNITATAVGTGVLYAVPFWVTDDFTADRLAIEVTATALNATVKVGIYGNTANDQPGELLYESASLDAAASAGVKEAIINQRFEPGLYWLAFVNQVAAISVRCLASTSYLPPVAASSFIGSNAAQEMSCYYTSGVNGAFPAQWASTLVGAAAPKIMVRVV